MNSKSRFDEVAAEWDKNPTRVQLAQAIGAAITREVPIEQTWRVLDYGAGTGLLSLNLQPKVASILAMDSSAGMLEELNKKLSAAQIRNITTREWDLETEALRETDFDLVVSSMTFHHLRNVPLVLGRLAAALKPGGWLAFADLDTEEGSFHGDTPGVFHKGFDRREIAEWVRGAGFVQGEVRDAYRVNKPDAAGQMRTYGVFLATARKPNRA